MVRRTDVARTRVASLGRQLDDSISKRERTRQVGAGEIGGRFSEEAHTFFRTLARAKVRSIPEPLRSRARPLLDALVGFHAVLRRRW